MPKNTFRNDFRILSSVAFGLITLSVLAIGLTIWGLRSDAIQEAENDTGNIAAVLSEHLARSIQSIDIVLTDIRERAVANTPSAQSALNEQIRSHDFYESLTEQLGHLSQAGFIAVIDQAGGVAITTQGWPTPNADVRDRDYFQHFEEGNDSGIYISNLLTSRVSGARTIFFSKRISGPNNAFLGVVLIGLRLSYFEGIYNSIATLRDRSFLLLKTDGTILVRYPDAIDRSNQKMPAGSPWYKLVETGGGHYGSPGYFDDQARLVSVQPLREYPLVINVAVSESAALAIWRWRATLIGIGTLLALISSAFLLRILRKQFHRLFRSEATLAEREASLAKTAVELRNANVHVDAALHNMSQGLCMFDAEGRIVLFNERYAKMMDLPAAWLKGRSLLDLFKQRKWSGEFAKDPQEFYARVIAEAREGKSSTRIMETPAGRSLRVVDQPMQEGGWVATFEDITEWQKAQAQISHMAHHDALTGLANRTRLVEKLKTALAVLPLRGGSVAVLFIDLDRFKTVNDTFGHDGGDFLLKTVAERLGSLTRADDIVARLGGDEFVVVQTGVKSKSQAEDFAHRLISVVFAPMKLGEQTLGATASIGIAFAPADGTNPERLLKSADLALYKAKAAGRNCIRFFVADMEAELQERFRLERTIHDAVLHGRFELHYQPLFEISGRRLDGFEALVRLPAEDGTLIPPLVFIPVAEDLRLIDKIGAWVLREACRTAATWPEHLTVAVNLSPAQFSTGNVSDVVVDALKETGLAADRLELEITETLLLGNSEAILAELGTLKAMGVAIVMDDFGTGYSSLSYLWRFPFDKIKIDRSFMQGFDGSGRDAKTVVKGIIALGHELNMRVTVEGVETAAQAAFLETADGDQAQGFFYGRPVSASEVSASILVDFQRVHPASSSTRAREGNLRLVNTLAKP